MPIARLALTKALTDRLETIPAATLRMLYVGEVGTPPTYDDHAGRVKPYAVLHPSPGRPPADSDDLAETTRDLDWLFQITVAGGHYHDLLAAIDAVDTAVRSWTPVVVGVSLATPRPPAGYDPGPIRRDDSTKPPRHYTALQYRLTATPLTTA